MNSNMEGQPPVDSDDYYEQDLNEEFEDQGE